MSRFLTLSGLALRELWISFRLLLLLGTLLLCGVPAALLPHVVTPNLAGAPPDPLAWFAIALAAAMAILAAVAAATMAHERRRGTAGWMAIRAVPRPTIVLAWFAAFALVLAAGLVPATALTWLSLGDRLPLVPPWSFGVAAAAAGCAGLAAVGLGLVLGASLPPLPAGLATAVPAGVVLLVSAVNPGWSYLPSTGLTVLASIDQAARPLADALRGAGLALTAAAALLVLAAAVFERAEL